MKKINLNSERISKFLNSIAIGLKEYNWTFETLNNSNIDEMRFLYKLLMNTYNLPIRIQQDRFDSSEYVFFINTENAQIQAKKENI